MLGKKIPESILLNAVFKLKLNPIKSQPSTSVTMETEEITVACLPGQGESGDDDALLDNEDNDDDHEMLKQIRETDWTNFDFSLPISQYKPQKTGPTKLE